MQCTDEKFSAEERNNLLHGLIHLLACKSILFALFEDVVNHVIVYAV